MVHKLSLQFLKEKEITHKIVEAYWKPAITHQIHVMLPSVTVLLSFKRRTTSNLWMSDGKMKTSTRRNLPKSPHVGLLKRLDEVDTHHTSIIFQVSNNYPFFYTVIFFNCNLAAFHTKLEKLCTISCSVLAVSHNQLTHWSRQTGIHIVVHNSPTRCL